MDKSSLLWLFEVICMSVALEYEVRCPVAGEWRFRGRRFNCSSTQYVCLFRSPGNIYHETCDGLDYSSTGSKLIYEPFFNKEQCHYKRYQPFPFSTDGSSECVYQKSFCNEKGQDVFHQGSFSSDTTCQCDLARGYYFVFKPRNNSYCIPSEEDCSCYKFPCKHRDDSCALDEKEMLTRPFTENKMDIFDNGRNIINKIGKQHQFQCLYITAVLLGVLICIIFLMETIANKFPPKDIIQQDMIKNVFVDTTISLESTIRSYLPLTSVVWQKEPGHIILEEQGPKSIPWNQGIWKPTIDVRGECESATYRCVVCNTVGRVKCARITIDSIKIDGDHIRQLFQENKSGKHHFARVIIFGKSRVGKSSLMRRLLWKEKDDAKSDQTTDGIAIKKCNIHVKDGRWSLCDEFEDDLTRFIHNVYREKVMNDSTDTRNDIGKHNSVAEYSNLNTEKIIKSKNNSKKITPTDNKAAQNFNNSAIHVTGSTNEPVPNGNIDGITSALMKSLYARKEECVSFDEMAFCLLFDFKGYEDIYAIHQAFLSRYAVYILVTDSFELKDTENKWIVNEQSLEYIRFWFDAIHWYWSITEKGVWNPQIIIVCTNADKFKNSSERQKQRDNLKASIDQILHVQELKRYLKQVYVVSNTDDTEVVFEEIRNDISLTAMGMEEWGKIRPLKWLIFQQVLERLKDRNIPISATKDLLQIAKRQDIDIDKVDDFISCLKYCHELGTVVYFDEDNLKDYVILDPRWLVDAFRCLVSDTVENKTEILKDAQKLRETGELRDSLVSSMYKKEPKSNFLENKSHVLEVMKRFGIIVCLGTSSPLYMPCMIKSCSYAEVKKLLIDDDQSFYLTSWLCLDFECLPPAVFNHIIAWYVGQSSTSILSEKEARTRKPVIYRKIGVFEIETFENCKLVVCNAPNVIALQIWDRQNSNWRCGKLSKNLFDFLYTLFEQYKLDISFTKTFKCKDGDFTIHRENLDNLIDKHYYCKEHKTTHLSDDLVQPWNFTKELKNLRHQAIIKRRVEETKQKELKKQEMKRQKELRELEDNDRLNSNWDKVLGNDEDGFKSFMRDSDKFARERKSDQSARKRRYASPGKQQKQNKQRRKKRGFETSYQEDY